MSQKIGIADNVTCCVNCGHPGLGLHYEDCVQVLANPKSYQYSGMDQWDCDRQKWVPVHETVIRGEK